MSTNSWEDVTAQIKDRLDIVDVVSQYVILKKKGQHYWGCCPFHNEKTPSFSVNPSRGIFKCFGCGEGGDVITFLMKIRNQSFKDVIIEHAQTLGIELPKSSGVQKQDRSQREQIFAALKEASEIFSKNLENATLQGAKKAYEYLNSRGITSEIINKYRLGYAQNDYESLYKELKKNYSDDILEKAGLIIKRENGSFVDRFRHRITIPIFDENGKIVAFGARALDEGQNPKYLNSPDTPVYAKSNIMYGIYHAKDAIKKEDAVIIMEGYFDVISTQAHGIENCIAACGTALTANHVKLISRYCPSRRIYLAFDADGAGRKAAERGAGIIKEEFFGLGEIKQFDENFISTLEDDKYACEIRVVRPPKGKDPDEFIREEGADKYRECIYTAPLLLDFQIDEILKTKTPNMTPIGKTRLVKELVPFLSEINNRIVRNEYILHISSVLDIDQNVLQKELAQIVTKKNPVISRKNDSIVKKTSNLSEKAQKNLLSLFMISVSDIDHEKLLERIRNIDYTDEKLIIVKNTIDKLFFQVNNVKELLQSLYTVFAQDEETRNIITELNDLSESFKNLDSKAYDEVINENIRTIEAFKEQAIQSELNNCCKDSQDEEKALMYQLKLREELMKKRKVEIINE